MAEPEVVSHWYQLIDGLQYSTEEFYKELRTEVETWKIPKATLSRVEHPEGHPIFSSKRLYFRVQRDDLVFDICGAEFGRGFFVSWWLVMPPGCLMTLASIPGLGLLLRPFMKRFTYYRIDTQLMFQDVVHAAVLKVLDDLIQVKELKPLTAEQRKPVMKEFFKR